MVDKPDLAMIDTWFLRVTFCVLTMQLRNVPLDKESRKEFLVDWRCILDYHLIDGAPYPVSILERSVTIFAWLFMSSQSSKCKERTLFSFRNNI